MIFFGIYISGNKSEINALKSGRSYFKNLGKFESIKAFINNKFSSVFPSSSYALSLPAITKTLLTDLRPKS